MILKRGGCVDDERGEETGLWITIPPINNPNCVVAFFASVKVGIFNSAESHVRVEKNTDTNFHTQRFFSSATRYWVGVSEETLQKSEFRVRSTRI